MPRKRIEWVSQAPSLMHPGREGGRKRGEGGKGGGERDPSLSDGETLRDHEGRLPTGKIHVLVERLGSPSLLLSGETSKDL